MSVPSLQLYVQGKGAVSADNLNTFPQTATSVVVLREFTASAYMLVYLQGYEVAGDGGQGFFYWNSAGTAPGDDGTTTVQPYGQSVGEWTRIPNGNSVPGNAVVSGGSAFIQSIQAITGIALDVPGPFTAFLPPDPTPNETHFIKDSSGDASVNNITVNGNGHLIDGSVSVVIGVNWGCLLL